MAATPARFIPPATPARQAPAPPATPARFLPGTEEERVLSDAVVAGYEEETIENFMHMQFQKEEQEAYAETAKQIKLFEDKSAFVRKQIEQILSSE